MPGTVGSDLILASLAVLAALAFPLPWPAELALWVFAAASVALAIWTVIEHRRCG